MDDTIMISAKELADRWKVSRQSIYRKAKKTPHLLPPMIAVSERGDGKTTYRFRLDDVVEHEKKMTKVPQVKPKSVEV